MNEEKLTSLDVHTLDAIIYILNQDEHKLLAEVLTNIRDKIAKNIDLEEVVE